MRDFAGVALDLGAGGEVADAVKDARSAIEMTGGGQRTIAHGQATGHPRRFGHHFQRWVWVGGDCRRHEARAFAGAANATQAFSGEQLHPFEQVVVGHALDSGDGVDGDGDAGLRLVCAIEPLHARKEMPEAVVGMTPFNLK